MLNTSTAVTTCQRLLQHVNGSYNVCLVPAAPPLSLVPAVALVQALGNSCLRHYNQQQEGSFKSLVNGLFTSAFPFLIRKFYTAVPG